MKTVYIYTDAGDPFEFSLTEKELSDLKSWYNCGAVGGNTFDICDTRIDYLFRREQIVAIGVEK